MIKKYIEDIINFELDKAVNAFYKKVISKS